MEKILYVTTVSRTINAFLVPHIEMLLNKGYQVDCACCIDMPVSDELLSRGVSVYNVPFSRNPLSITNFTALRRLNKLEKMNGYDMIHVHTPVAAMFGRLLKIKFSSVKTIYTAHGYHFYKGAPKKNWAVFYTIEKAMAKLTDATININEEDYEVTMDRLHPKSCYLVNGVGIDLRKYKKTDWETAVKKRKEFGLSEDDFLILAIAEVNKNKNYEQLIDAMEIEVKKHKNIKVLSVGSGGLIDSLKEEVKNRGLSNNVIFLGFRNDIVELINMSDIGILLSYREGLPRSIMEFMAMGRKVIGTNIRGIRDLLEDESVGTLVELHDYKATAEAIEKYYKANDRSFKVPAAIKKYEVQRVTEQLEKIYNAVDYKEYVYYGNSQSQSM